MEEGTTQRIEEMQGWEGPYSLPEWVVQRIWAQGEFLREGLRVEDGRRLVVQTVGTWNRGAGPDFKGAVLFLDGVRWEGDVEIHVRASDWEQHGHREDPAYSAVILHVVLFPTAQANTTGWAGGSVPLLVLLPQLLHDLEDYAYDLSLEQTLPAAAGSGADSRGPVDPEPWARARWLNKVARARARLEAWGWSEAMHATALEVLGFAQNRMPMLKLARLYPFAASIWPNDRSQCADRMEHVSGWCKRGVRPANQPLARLGQYGRWCHLRPAWPTDLLSLAPPQTGAETWAGWSLVVGERITGGQVKGSRWETFLLEAAIPYLSAVGAWSPEIAFRTWSLARPGEVDRAAAESAHRWWIERSASVRLSHGIVQAWKQWRADLAWREGETGARGLTSIPSGE